MYFSKQLVNTEVSEIFCPFFLRGPINCSNNYMFIITINILNSLKAIYDMAVFQISRFNEDLVLIC